MRNIANKVRTYTSSASTAAEMSAKNLEEYVSHAYSAKTKTNREEKQPFDLKC